MQRTELRLRYQKETGDSWTEVNAQPTIGYTRWLEGVIMMQEMNLANGANTRTEPALPIQDVVCSALDDETATKMLAHCPYEKSGWCTTELGCRFKLENCDAKGNGCELAL